MPQFEFMKSSYSSGNGECVEVALNMPGAVAVRDSKRPAGPLVLLAPAAWDAFRAGVAK
ncbi:DUF397 domain-containing protein [Streptomyces sp. H27-C3]|uniref:DUF397 domain-containing protein n=1 Tax=Streptomyces sp. H27-C3 TaxID=3046305 RepID=UPI0024B8D8F5|nr:DUF397 domain-containing protein [Streptomyces sp. H27-C3]MDJ0461963.1 DUF397 domain-containing protein [Streptomyces sp. H27-C3]